MPLTLYLLRHAKSSWSDPSRSDIERPLNKRGRKGAKQIGEYLAALPMAPDLVLCSPAERTQETLGIVQSCFPSALPVEIRKKLYGGSILDQLSTINSVPGDVSATLLVGHNPQLSILAMRLADKSTATPKKLRMGMPTGALVHLEFDCASWPEVSSGDGRVVGFVTPKKLKDAEA